MGKLTTLSISFKLLNWNNHVFGVVIIALLSLFDVAYCGFITDSVFSYFRSLMPLLKGTYLGLSTIAVNQIVKLKRYVQYITQVIN